MGVTIAFKGKLKSPELAENIIEDVEDICRTNNWWYRIIDEKQTTSVPPSLAYDKDNETGEVKRINIEGELGLKGISFQMHQESETIELFFDTEGVLRPIFSMIFKGDSRIKYPWVFVKTQFAGAETHIKIINLLLYLRKKYFKKLEINDDGGYYPKRDEKTLHQLLSIINNAIATLSDVFENSEFSGTPDQIMNQVQDALSRSLKDMKIQIIKMDINELPKDLKKRLKKGDANNELPF
jgi:hypothetical protein